VSQRHELFDRCRRGSLFGPIREEKEPPARTALGRGSLCGKLRELPRYRTGGAAKLAQPWARRALPAPPPYETGHAWHHSDEQLLAIVCGCAPVGCVPVGFVPVDREVIEGSSIEESMLTGEPVRSFTMPPVSRSRQVCSVR